MGMGTVNLYESPALREFTQPVIRPGGFELTARGLTHCQMAPNARVLDVGCGTGATVDYLRKGSGFMAMGLDFSTILLQEGARTYGDSPLVQGSAEQLPLAAGSFGAVLCECVLSLCPDPLHVLGQIRQVLQPGGYLVLTDVYSQEPHTAANNNELPLKCCLAGAVDQSTTINRIKTAGFELLLWEDHSKALKQLAGQLVWTYGSLDAFWTTLLGPDAANVMTNSKAGGCRRPGYYLLVARKK
jgi:arsenite methyltransferase